MNWIIKILWKFAGFIVSLQEEIKNNNKKLLEQSKKIYLSDDS